MTQNDPPPLTAALKDRYFPLARPRMGVGVFELGLTLTGTVSAGAYTGGVLDFLMQALDAWEVARADPSIPQHRVVISTLGGASGGAINGAVMLRAAGIAFPRGADPDNPFYATWTQGVTLQSLLGTDDGADQGLRSLLNCNPIAAQAEAVVRFPGAPLGTSDTPAARGYFADPLRLAMMVTNLAGVPYRVSMTGDTSLGHDMVAHGDWVRFALGVPGGVVDAVGARLDEYALTSASALNWDLVANAALCTSAFPFAFRAEPISRALTVLSYRAVLVPGETAVTDQVVMLAPLWDSIRAAQPDGPNVASANLDGGVTNNDPMDMVRMTMSGMAARNPRQANLAYRAVIMVSPFTNPEVLPKPDVPGLLGLVGPFIGGLVAQARYKPADLALAQEESVASRFLIAPVGPNKNGVIDEGSAVIASGGLSGFLGFVDRGFLTYDFLLGRWNAYRFLQSYFAFPEDNFVFAEAGMTESQKASWSLKDAAGNPALVNGLRQIQLIPLLPGAVATPPGAWPKLAEVPPWLDGAVKARLDLLVGQAKAELLPTGFTGGILSVALSGIWALCAGTVRGKIVGALTDQLKGAGLV